MNTTQAKLRRLTYISELHKLTRIYTQNIIKWNAWKLNETKWNYDGKQLKLLLINTQIVKLSINKSSKKSELKKVVLINSLILKLY